MDGLLQRTRFRTWAIGPLLVLLIVLLIALAIIEVLASRASAREPRVSGGAPWAPHIERLDAALARDDVSGALRAWGQGYTAALGSRSWEGLIEVGDAYLRIGDHLAHRRAFVPRARVSYLSALFRARQQRSLDGVLRAAEAFAALGDHDVVVQCLEIAREIAGADPSARARVMEHAARLSEPPITAGALRIEP